MAYIGSGKPCCNPGPANDDGPAPMMTELGQFVDAALSIASWIGGMFSFGGKPLTKAGKNLAGMMKNRGVEGRAADGWAREYEKKRDGECKNTSGEARRQCWANQIERMVSQLNPPITAAEMESLRNDLASGGFHLPGHELPAGQKWLPSALRGMSPLPGGPSINPPGFPGGPAGGGGGVLQAGMGGGIAGALLLGLGLMFALSKPGARRR